MRIRVNPTYRPAASSPSITSEAVVRRLEDAEAVTEAEVGELGHATTVRAMSFSRSEFRLALNLNLDSEDDFRKVLDKVSFVLQEFNENRRRRRLQRKTRGEAVSRIVTVV